jgi:CRISPR/Cas system CMR-associated protein Cmr1 (group 7 of RAMP superfamily)
MGIDMWIDDLHQSCGSGSGIEWQKTSWIKGCIGYLEKKKLEIHTTKYKNDDDETEWELDELVRKLKESVDEEAREVIYTHFKNFELVHDLNKFGVVGVWWWVYHSFSGDLGYFSPGQCLDMIETLDKIIEFMDEEEECHKASDHYLYVIFQYSVETRKNVLHS